MPNTIKTTSGEYAAPALQVTKPARAAGLVEEDADGEATYLAETRVHAFEGLLVVADRERVDRDHAAELVASAARDSGTAFDARKAAVSRAGDGYRVQLPPADDAGFAVGDPAQVHTAPDLLVVATSSQRRLARDLVELRNAQLSSSS